MEPAKPDPFQCELSPPPSAIVKGEEEFEVEAIIQAAMKGYERNCRCHYLVRWKGYRPEYDEWVLVEEMEHAKELIEEFKKGEQEKMDMLVH